MEVVPAVTLPWLVTFINEYADQPRDEAGEAAQPYPALQSDGRPPAVSRMSSAGLARIASTLWPVFAAASVEARAAALNQLLRDADLTPFVTPAGQSGWVTAHSAADAVVAASCAVALLGTVGSLGWLRLGICEGSDCVDVYIDQTGRTPRRYCSETCLNRARVRAYRSRRRNPA
jgi:predicted RNA-binding Zn ribbon-like protein